MLTFRVLCAKCTIQLFSRLDFSALGRDVVRGRLEAKAPLAALGDNVMHYLVHRAKSYGFVKAFLSVLPYRPRVRCTVDPHTGLDRNGLSRVNYM